MAGVLRLRGQHSVLLHAWSRHPCPRPRACVLTLAVILLCCLPCSFFGVNAQPNGSSSLPTVVISEVMSKNGEYPVQGQDGPTPDWIELENFGDEWVNMGGFVITDGDTFEEGFVFPDDFAIGPLQRVLLLADGSGRFVKNNLHLDFKLKSSGEKITLFDPSGAIISSVDVPELETDQVYGLLPDVSPATAQATGEGYAILNEPTPGAPNAAAAPEEPFDVRAIEVLGPVTGSFPVEVEIIEQTQEVQGVTLTYLVNGVEEGSIPMTSSGDERYTATIPEQSPGAMIQWYFTVTDASGTTTRFPRFATPTSREYYGTFVDNPSLATNLPVVDLYCKDKDAPFLEGKDATPGCSVMVNGHFYDNIIVRRRGVSSIAWPKPKFKVDAGDQGKIFQIFEDDDRTVKEFNMNSEWAEPGENSFMRETLAWKALKEMGVDALDYYQTQVRLNGEYFGKFSLGEDWDEDPLDEAGYATPGPLMKSISGEYSNLRWDLDPWQAQFYYRPISLKDEDAFRDLSDFTQGLAGAYCGSRSSYVYDHVNLPKTINYMAAMTLMLNQDRCTKNFYVYQDPKDELWTMLPWDVEAAFGTDRGLGGKPAPDYCILECEQWNSPLFCDKNHPQDLKVTTPWGLITTIIDPDRAAKRRRLASAAGFPGMTDGTPLNGAAKLGLSLPNTSSIPANYDGDQRNLYEIPQGARGTYNFLIDAILSIPTTRAMYMRRLRTLMDEFLSTDRLKTLATEEYNLIKEEAQRDIEFWGNSGDVERGYTQIVSEQIPLRTQQLYGTYGPDGEIPLIPEAQPSDATIEIEQVTPGPNGYVKIVNPNDIALDISGWAIKGGDTFEYDFIPGTVIPANGEAYIAMNPTALRKSMASSSQTNDSVQCSNAFILPGEIQGTIPQDATPSAISITRK